MFFICVALQNSSQLGNEGFSNLRRRTGQPSGIHCNGQQDLIQDRPREKIVLGADKLQLCILVKATDCAALGDGGGYEVQGQDKVDEEAIGGLAVEAEKVTSP